MNLRASSFVYPVKVGRLTNAMNSTVLSGALMLFKKIAAFLVDNHCPVGEVYVGKFFNFPGKSSLAKRTL